jgi:hypothetical protein
LLQVPVPVRVQPAGLASKARFAFLAVFFVDDFEIDERVS